MAWISIENLGLYHQKLKDWFSKQSISATKIIQDTENRFVSDEQIKTWNARMSSVVQLDTELPVGHTAIAIPESYKITENNVWLFVDGIKLIRNKHFVIDSINNSLMLLESYKTIVNVEVIIFI